MRRKIIISVLVVVILLIAGYAYWAYPPAVCCPAITSDNSGGAIVIYEVYKILRKHDFYIQRISPQGDFLWGEKGILIGSGYKSGYGIFGLYAVSDGSGGAIVIWRESLRQPEGGPPYAQTHVVKIDSEGNVQWQRDVPAVEKAIPDGSGGIIIAFNDLYENLSVLKIDAEGNLPWGEDGVSLNHFGYTSRRDIASDNSGGVIAVQAIYGQDIICAQRVDSEGNILWESGGVQVFGGPADDVQVAGDGSGGAIIAFERNIPSEDGIGFCDSDIYAQRVDAEGNILWGPDGVPIRIGPTKPYDPEIVYDGTGGAIIFFVEERGICAQRVDADGHKLWPGDAIQVWKGTYHHVVSDGFGGAISVWDERAQRLDATGREMWGLNGTIAMLNSRGWYSISEDGCGGVLISWAASRFILDETASYVQGIDAEGNLLWGDRGILLNR